MSDEIRYYRPEAPAAPADASAGLRAELDAVTAERDQLRADLDVITTERDQLKVAALPEDALQRIKNVNGVGDKLAPIILDALTAQG